MTPKPDPKAIAECTWESPMAVITQGKFRGMGDPRLLAGILLLVMIILYAIFA